MSLPDWLVERVALDEVPAASRGRVTDADPAELAARVATLRDETARELASHPAAPALAQIQARVAREQIAATQRRKRIAIIGMAVAAAAGIVLFVGLRKAEPVETQPDEITRVKGAPRLLAFRNAGDHGERLEQDALVKAGDVIQLRYNAGGHKHGLIASIDGAGVVTLHFPASEDGSTVVAGDTTSLPNAYVLDDAPKFERFFIITSNEPIDVADTLDVLRDFAHRDDCADAKLDLPKGTKQWSLRLRKPETP